MEMRRYLFTVSYDGTDYSGFQVQKNSNTIQAELEKSLSLMTMHPVTVFASGRTDKGVHAIKQTFHIDLNFEILKIDRWIEGLNKRLPDDIIVTGIKEVNLDFHARHSAKKRVYKYVISKKPSTIYNQRFELYVKDFNLELAQKASLKFVGVKDFTGFSKLSKEKDPIKVIYDIKIKETKDRYIFTFIGKSFLRHMVRSIMGTIIEVSTNKIDLTIIDEIFLTNNRKLAGKTAAAKALFLEKVIY